MTSSLDCDDPHLSVISQLSEDKSILINIAKKLASRPGEGYYNNVRKVTTDLNVLRVDVGEMVMEGKSEAVE